MVLPYPLQNGAYQVSGGAYQTDLNTGPTVISGFNSDLLAWSGNTGAFAIATSGAIYEGSGALQSTANGYNHIRSLPGDGLNYYPEAGDPIEFRTYIPELPGTQVFVVWGIQQDAWTPQSYGFRIDTNSGQISLQKCPSAGSTYNTIASTSISYTGHTTEWLRGRVDWGADGTMIGSVYDASGTQLGSSIQATDPDYTAGGVAVETDNGGGAPYPRIDYLVSP